MNRLLTWRPPCLFGALPDSESDNSDLEQLPEEDILLDLQLPTPTGNMGIRCILVFIADKIWLLGVQPEQLIPRKGQTKVEHYAQLLDTCIVL